MKKTIFKTPTVLQMEATECGAASLAMICAYYGKYIPLEQMRVETSVSRDGCSAANIKRAAARLEMDCHAYKMEPEELKNARLPCILHWNFAHFLVLEGFRGQYAYLNDPAVGRRCVTMQELDESFTGVVLTFAPAPSFRHERRGSFWRPLLNERLHTARAALPLLASASLLLALPAGLLPLFAKIFLDRLPGGQNARWPGGFLALLATLFFAQSALLLYRGVLLSRLQQHVCSRSMRTFLSRLFRLPVAFFEQRYAGDLVDRVQSSDDVNAFLTGELFESALGLVSGLLLLIPMFCFSPVLSLIGLAGTLAGALLLLAVSGGVSDGSIRLEQSSGRLIGILCAGLGVTPTLKASGAQHAFVSRVLGHAARAHSQQQSLSRLQTAVCAIPNAAGVLTQLALLLVSALFVLHGDMTVGDTGAFLCLYAAFCAPVSTIAESARRIHSFRAQAQRAGDILRYPADPACDPAQPAASAKLSGRVECRSVSFGYGPLGEDTLHEIDLSLAPGCSLALVGASGSGKSTIGRLIGGLYTPRSGELLFDGMPPERIAPDVLHASIASVSQKCALFSGTIRENIRMWNPAILDKDVIAAAKDSCIHDIIIQKSGAYDHVLSEGGANLSGGQRQRIEIARALALNPTLLILDEATSALEPAIERKILSNIRRRGCACIVIAHRLSTVRDCDEIAVIENGRIVQRGTHSALCAIDGPYRRLMAAQ